MTSAADVRPAVTRRPGAGIAIDPGYLEHKRNMARLSRAQMAERIGLELFDWDRFARILDGAEPPDARTLRLVARVLGTTAGLTRGGRLDMRVLGLRLISRGWSRDDLADKVARAGRSRDSVAKIENGERRPTPGTLGALCTVLGCEPEELMTGEPPRSASRQAAAEQAREEYYAGLRAFAEAEGIPWTDENGEPCFSPELRREYDGFLLGGSQLAS